MRLPACDKWHPNEPSNIVVWSATTYGNRTYMQKARMVCKLCKRIRYKSRPPTAKEIPLRALGKPYGVIPLKWTPPPEEYL